MERGVPKVYGSRYDVWYLLNAAISLPDGEEPDIPLPFLVRKKLEKTISGTEVEKMLKEYNLI